jgi:hypothetical protein
MFLHVSDVYNSGMVVMLIVWSESDEEICVARLTPNEIMSVIFSPKC